MFSNHSIYDSMALCDSYYKSILIIKVMNQKVKGMYRICDIWRYQG